MPGPGSEGEPAWAAAAVVRAGELVGRVVVSGEAAAPYAPGLLALREGPILEKAVRSLPSLPDVLLVNATARDHPRRGGLALHLGAVLDLPTIGVTHRPLFAEGEWPAEERGALTPLVLEDEVVGCWLRTRRGRRPLAVHPGWRTELEVAVEVVLATTGRSRAPEPLRQARRAARLARAGR
jgi:deoxyribonuclease V